MRFELGMESESGCTLESSVSASPEFKFKFCGPAMLSSF